MKFKETNLSDTLAIIQFTHPGQEHNKNNGEWNYGPHKRKFMRCKGNYIKNGQEQNGDLLFWGEWEAPSTVNEFIGNAFPLPKWLHSPYIPNDNEIPSPNGKGCGNNCKSGSPQNTDPYVFGNKFKYCICKQSMFDMANLDIGSLILFGSTKPIGRDKEIQQRDSYFMLDTVFVVAGFVQGNTVHESPLLDNTYKKITLNMLPDYPDWARVYFGATYNETVNGMYSFSPVKEYKNGESFPRIKLKDLEYITNNLNAAPKITKTIEKNNVSRKINKNDIYNFWDKIRIITNEAGCYEGVYFDEPPMK